MSSTRFSTEKIKSLEEARKYVSASVDPSKPLRLCSHGDLMVAGRIGFVGF